MTFQQKTILILVHILVLKLNYALGNHIQSTTVAYKSRIVQPSGYAYRHVVNQHPEIVYYADQTTLKVDMGSNLKWLSTTPRTRATRTSRLSVTTTTTPKPYVRSELRKADSSESDTASGVSNSSDESHFLNSSDESLSESYETIKNKVKSKNKKKKKEPTTTTTTTVKPLIFRTLNRFPQPQIYRIPCNISPVYRIPARTEPLPVPVPVPVPIPLSTPQYPPNRILFQPKSYPPQRSPNQQNQFIVKGPPLPFTGFVRLPTYRTFIVKTKPREPPPQPPFHHQSKPEVNDKNPTDKKDSPKEEDHISTKQDDTHDSKEENRKKKKHKKNSSEETHYSNEHHYTYNDDDKPESSEDGDEKSTGYEVHESHEEKDAKKYNEKDGTEKSGHKHGHEATEKKDNGAHAADETGFKKEEGIIYNIDNRKHKGFNTNNVYNKHDHFDKGKKGGYDEEKKSKFGEKEQGGKESKHAGAKHYGEKDHSYRDDKGGKYNEQKLHKTGAKTVGYHNIFHKDEFKKVRTYYDGGDEQGKHFNFGDEHKQYDVKKDSDEDGGEHGEGHHKWGEKKNGHLRKAKGDDENEAWTKKNNQTKGFSEDQGYAKESGHNAKSQRGQRWK